MTHEVTTLRAAAQQALEALKVATTPLAKDRQEVLRAQDNLRAALAQQAEPAQDRHRACPTHCCPVHGCKYGHDDCPVAAGAVQPVYPRNNECESCADDALHQQAEPVEPVAWRFKPMIGLPWSLSDDGYYISCIRDQRYFVEPLYTAPPQRQSLAEWQINDLMAGIDPEDVCSWSFRQGVYAAEKHHGVKP